MTWENMIFDADLACESHIEAAFLWQNSKIPA